MTVAGDIEDHQARCQAHLAALRMLGYGEAETAHPLQAAAEVVRATGAILAEAEVAGREARSAGPGTARLLLARLHRLSAAADDAIASAQAGNDAEMRRRLHRFEALTAAIWDVQRAVSGPPAPRSAGTR
jgi:hypothetical protein